MEPVFACVFTYEIIISELRSRHLYYHVASGALKRCWRRRVGGEREGEREKKEEQQKMP